MRPMTAIIVAALGVLPGVAAEKANPLTEPEVADGWVSLFDGETTFGWKAESDKAGGNVTLTAKDGILVCSGSDGRLTCTTPFRECRLAGEYRVRERAAEFGLSFGVLSMGGPLSVTDGDGWRPFSASVGPPGVVASVNDKPVVEGPLAMTAGAASCRLTFQLPETQAGSIELRNVKLKPEGMSRLFNTKDLAGWKLFDADPKNVKAAYTVTPAGELAVTGGPGDLQTTAKYDDFVLQARAKTRRPGMNSGFFYRCIEGQYQNGYEVQIQNSVKDNDRTKPLDFGTGAIYRRVPARKVVSTDGEWFTLTVIADGPHVSTWVNGYQVVDWTDDRPRDPNPRKGLRTEAGHISIQGHGPPMTADIVFQSIKLAELKPAK
jgi:hypothetical protein